MNASAAALELLAQLADKVRRTAAANAVARAVGCDAFYVLVLDTTVDAFVPAPGFAQTLPSAAWRTVLDCCRTPGEHRIEVIHAGTTRAATVRCDGNAGLVFVGDIVDAAIVDALALALPVVGAVFRNEQAATAAAGQLHAAHDAARHARLLSAALSAARADMERALADTARLNAELTDADRRKNEFLAMLAHELRNPLSPILTALQLVSVRRERGEPFDHELSVMGRQLSHLTRLVDDLLDVSRITRGRIELRMATVQLAEVLHQAIVTSQPLLDQKQHTFTLEAVPEDIFIRGDFVRLLQVFANVLNNAAKYTDPGGVIELRTVRRDGEVAISIRDNGIGIAPDVLLHVFELFVQAPRALDRAQGGLGIGLTLVKALVEMQGGRIAAHSNGEGRGSEFTITLPTVAAEVKQTTRSAERPHAAELHILVVDDNQDSAEMLSEILRLWGHSVHIADEGLGALRLAAQYSFDLVVLDIGLPGLDGYQVARRLRSESTVARIIALSGYGDAEHRRMADEAGFDGYLVKPVDPSALREVLFAAAPQPVA